MNEPRFYLIDSTIYEKLSFAVFIRQNQNCTHTHTSSSVHFHYFTN